MKFGLRADRGPRGLDHAQAKPRQLLDRGKEGALGRIAQRDRHARCAGARRPSDAVHIALRLVRNIEIDDVGDAVDIDAARRDVGRDQDRHMALPECGERALPRGLRLVAVDRLGPNAGPRQALGDAIGAVLGAGEDERARDRRIAQQTGENEWLLGGGGEDDALIDALDRGCRRRHLGPDRLVQDAGREPVDAVGHGRREEQGLTLLGQERDDPAHIRKKAHVEHAVGLVEDENREPVEAHGLLRREIEKAARRRDENVGAAHERIDLRLLPDAAEHDGAAKRKMPAIGAKAFADLNRELARRRQDERARRARRRFGAMVREPVQNRQRERRGLAGPGLRESDDIAAREQGRDGLDLDRCWGEVFFCRQRTQQRLGEVKVGE